MKVKLLLRRGWRCCRIPNNPFMSARRDRQPRLPNSKPSQRATSSRRPPQSAARPMIESRNPAVRFDGRDTRRTYADLFQRETSFDVNIPEETILLVHVEMKIYPDLSRCAGGDRRHRAPSSRLFGADDQRRLRQPGSASVPETHWSPPPGGGAEGLAQCGRDGRPHSVIRKF